VSLERSWVGYPGDRGAGWAGGRSLGRYVEGGGCAAALDAGARIVNDVTALRGDAEMAALAPTRLHVT